MKIQVTHPIRHDDVEYGRGVHAFPEKLAKKLLVEAQHAVIPFAAGTSDPMPGSVTLPHSSKVALQRNILERIDGLRQNRNRLVDLGVTAVEDIDGEIGVLQWEVRCIQYGNASEQTLEDHRKQEKRFLATVSPQAVETIVERSKARRPRRTDLKSLKPPNEQRCRLYVRIHQAKLFDPQTGKLRKLPASETRDVYDRIFSETISQELILSTCHWELPHTSFRTIGDAWEANEKVIRRLMTVWLRKLIADCAPHREQILHKPKKTKSVS